METKRIWMDGAVEQGDFPHKLLSDNIGYYGACISTGMSYTYEDTVLVKDADTQRDREDRRGRRLLDGYLRNHHNADPMADKSARVVFDFKKEYLFRELDFVTRTSGASVRFWGAVNKEEWTQLCEQETSASLQEPYLLRSILEQPARCRYIRMEVEADGPVSLCQFYGWGERAEEEESGSAAQITEGDAPMSINNSVTLQSIPGIDRTAFRDVDAFYWVNSWKNSSFAHFRAVWSVLDNWGEITHKPIMPNEQEINPALSLRMVRNESRCLCLALTSFNLYAQEEVEIRVDGLTVEGLKTQVFGMGAIPSLWYGVNGGPLFSADNKINAVLMEKHLTNAHTLWDFPRVTLPPCGTVIVWFKVTGSGVLPGSYSFTLSAGGAQTEITVQVEDIELPQVDCRICAYSGITEMHPFRYEDRYERELEYQAELGINRFVDEWPEPGSYLETARRLIPNPIFGILQLGDYHHKLLHGEMKEEDWENARQDVKEIMEGYAQKAKSLGLSYSEWEADLPDEPGKGNMENFGRFARLMKDADPDARIYVNPCFWAGWENGGTSPDEEAWGLMKDWYNEVVDSSCPSSLNLVDRPKSMELYTAPRAYNTFYTVSAQHMKCERRDHTEFHRMLAWLALRHGFNGWAYYAYYRPEGDPWCDFDGTAWVQMADYALVYPGEKGPIPTRASEAAREGYQDYRLMKLLERSNPEAYQEVLDAYINGEQDFDRLRESALDVLVTRVATEGDNTHDDKI